MMILHFNIQIFVLSQLSADANDEVRRAMSILDTLLKDIVCECPTFDMHQFVAEINTRFNSSSPESRQFLIGWIQVICSKFFIIHSFIQEIFIAIIVM
jgi:hypothetical protein